MIPLAQDFFFLSQDFWMQLKILGLDLELIFPQNKKPVGPGGVLQLGLQGLHLLRIL